MIGRIKQSTSESDSKCARTICLIFGWLARTEYRYPFDSKGYLYSVSKFETEAFDTHPFVDSRRVSSFHAIYTILHVGHSSLVGSCCSHSL
jgi:hypothetical protein